jgi:predicted ATPase/HPt (histidine-containing phosphotransfer) domain-containing protein
LALSDYQVTETIAQSGRNVLRRALRVRSGERVLIKSPVASIPSVHDVRQLEFEHRLLRKLDLDVLLAPVALEKSGNEVALVLADFAGRPPRIGARGISLRVFFELAVAITKALGELHARGVIHKGLQPKSVLWDDARRTLKLTDLHSASELASERQDVGVVTQLSGMLPYLSPEQTGRMNRDLDYRTDYYSLGVTLFELLTGARPFHADDAMGWVHCHLSRRAPRACDVNPDVPPMVSEIVSTLMAKDPDERYQSARGLLADLERCREQWSRTGTMGTFALRAKDVSERFQVPQKLFGRAPQVSLLLDLFEEVSGGAARMLLVSGYSGVGKSSLIHEIERPIVRQHGLFLSGKFEQLERNVPYGALVQGFRKLVRQLLAETDERLAQWRKELTRALGLNGQIIVALIPELEQIIGAQAAPPELNAMEAQHRFRRVLREFIKVFARPGRPLVVFLDDLQWMDASMPELLVDLFVHGELSHFLLLGAYRDNEVAEGHPLPTCVRAVRERRPDAVRELMLAPLAERDVNQLVAETLHSDEALTQPLTHVIFDKTEGNPLFISELLRSLHRDGAFVFQPEQGRWEWSIEQVRQAAASDSVGELMVERLGHLPLEARHVLKIAACVGRTFDLATLALVSGQNVARVADALWEPTLQRIVVPLDENYRLIRGGEASDEAADVQASYAFQHDRVQHALYALLDAQERAILHAKIGRLLLANAEGADRADLLFEVVNHLNLGCELIEEEAERALVSRLNAEAAVRAKRSAAYAIAAEYLAHALSLLDPALGVEQAESAYELLRQRAECLFLTGEVERAALLCEELFDYAFTRVQRGSAFYLKTRIIEHQGKLIEAVATVRAGLRVLGVELPEERSVIDERIGDGIARMRGHLERVPIAELAKLPELQDPEKVMVLNLLFQVIPPAIQTNPPLFILAELMMFDLALTSGTADVSCKNFVDCGIIQGAVLGNYEVAYQLGLAAFELLERYRTSGLGSAVHFVFANFISHWRAPFGEGVDANATAIRLGLESGDVQHAAYASVHRCQRMLLVGRHLDECDAENRSALAYLKSARAVGQLIGMLVTLRAVARLTGGDGGPAAAARADAEAAATLEQTKNAQWSFSFGQAAAMVSFLLGDLESARRWQRFAEPFVAAGNGLFALVDYRLFEALIALRQATAPAERAAALALAEQNLAQLTRWAESSPANFLHKQKLLAAELGRARGDALEGVIKLYDEAIEATGDAFVQFSALAHELAAALWRERGHPKLADTMLRGAHQLYARWGAREKLRLLEQAHGWLGAELDALQAGAGVGEGKSPAAARSLLDLSSAFKATQAISSEVKPERLFATLMGTIIENAGAERGCLLLRRESDQRLYVAASANVEGSTQDSSQPLWLESAPNVCRDLVRYVVRTRETLVLDDALREGGFQEDPYVQALGVHSVLCMPILNQGELLAILYAENNAAPRAFTSERLGILQLIASQAAISITNALLYDSLEEKVAERTAELAQKNRETAAMLNGMEQGVFTIDEQLVIQPQYSKQLARILGSELIAGQPCLPLLFRDADVEADAMTAMEAALRFAFGVRAFLAEANMQHLVREFSARRDGHPRHFEVDWSLILDAGELVAKVLVVVRDVTMLKQLKETAARKSRETDIVGQILDSGTEAFLEFCETSRGLFDQSRGQLAAVVEPSPALLATLFRNAHTVKGNARLLGYAHLVAVVHSAEELYAQLRAGAGGPGDKQRLLRGLDAMQASVDEYEVVYRRKLRPLAQGRDAKLERATREIQRVVLDPEAERRPERALSQVRECLARLRAAPLAELVRGTSRMLPALAHELQRSVPAVECTDDAGVLLRGEWSLVMRDVLVQAFRNSLAHGIEPEAERRAAGKEASGVVRVRAEWREGGMRVCLSDDGRGMPLAALGELAGKRNGGAHARGDEELAELALTPGVSTARAVSDLAGRGVGMDVMRTAVRRLGGDLQVRFLGERRAGHRPFELVVTLPESALLLASDGGVPRGYGSDPTGP